MKFALLSFLALMGSAYAADAPISCSVMGAINHTAVKPFLSVDLIPGSSADGVFPNAEQYTYSVGRDGPNSTGASLIQIIVKKDGKPVATVFGYDHAYLIYEGETGLFGSKSLELEVNCGDLQE